MGGQVLTMRDMATDKRMRRRGVRVQSGRVIKSQIFDIGKQSSGVEGAIVGG